MQVDGGVFSATRLDPGSRVLLRTLEQRERREPSSSDRQFLDVGCGWGALSLALALKHPEAQITAVDVNERALRNTTRNAATLGLSGVRAIRPDAVDANVMFDEIWSNPPIRIGKTALHELLMTWIPRLKADGQAFLVVAKHLGAESLTRWLDDQPGFRCVKISQDKGFWILNINRRG